MHGCWTDVARGAGWRAAGWTRESHSRGVMGAGCAIPVLFRVVLGLTKARVRDRDRPSHL
eukprot:8731191-Pyramimonas_sp.AAC.1